MLRMPSLPHGSRARRVAASPMCSSESPHGRVQDFTGKLSFPWPADGVTSARAGAGALFARGFGFTYRDPGHVELLPESAASTGARGRDERWPVRRGPHPSAVALVRE